jgi:nicotinamidase-related amidase
MVMRTAVLAIHYQNEVLHPEGRIRLGVAEGDVRRISLIEAARHLLAGARAHSVPVVSVRIAFGDFAEVAQNAEMWRRIVAGGLMEEGSWGAEFYEGLAPLPGERVVTHSRNDAFYKSSLGAVLKELRPQRLVIAGIATNFAVESTARHASDAGYDVVITEDACSAASREAHRASLATLAMLAEVTSVAAVVASFAKGRS